MRFSSETVISLAFSITSLSSSYGWISSPSFRRETKQSGLFSTAGRAINHNIVLQPTCVKEDPTAFDNFKIGSARVHRYSREDDPDSETEYVMWYHGRSKELEDGRKETSIPPLSTGRIGRATSKNGLAWVKTKQGSESEDHEAVNLGLNQESWWGFDTAHVGLGNVLLPMSTPAVLTEGGVYLMYFFGGSFEETRIADYTSGEVSEGMKDATIAGMKMRIGVAVSQDGVSYGRVEGDDPTGACMVPFDKNDPNQRGTAPADMPEELYCGWPEVVVDLQGGKKASSFRMYYSTMLKESKTKCIGYAVSEDGFRWFKKGICINPDDSGFDAGGCARCCVVRDAYFDEDLATWTERKGWKMYYEGVSPEDGKHRIMVAESPDGEVWKKTGMALDIGNSGSWDESGVGSPHLVRLDDGSIRMYYTGQGADGSTAIGVAKLVGDDSEDWVREQATITFSQVQ